MNRPKRRRPTRQEIYRTFGFVNPPPVRCRECRKTIANPKWSGWGWVVAMHATTGGKICSGTGMYGFEN